MIKCYKDIVFMVMYMFFFCITFNLSHLFFFLVPILFFYSYIILLLKMYAKNNLDLSPNVLNIEKIKYYSS